jgi:transketolase
VTDQTTTKVDEGATSRTRDPSLAAPLTAQAGWTDVDVRAVDTVRLLAADAVQKVGNGHPGTAMSLAPLALFAVPERHASRSRRSSVAGP